MLNFFYILQKQDFFYIDHLKHPYRENLKRSSKLVSATCASPQRVLPIIIWRARHDRRHPRSKGPGKEFIYFFLQEKWATFLWLYIRPGNHRGCIGGGLHETHGIITRVVAMEGNPLEAEAASCLPHPCSAFWVHMQAQKHPTQLFHSAA